MINTDGRDDAETVLKIVSGESFGMCAGYCYSEITWTAEKKELQRRTWGRGQGGAPDLFYDWDDAGAEWKQLAELVDYDQLIALDSVYGCPDCADGGSEWIEVTTRQGEKRVVFEFNNSVKEIAPLLDQARTLRAATLELVTGDQ